MTVEQKIKRLEEALKRAEEHEHDMEVSFQVAKAGRIDIERQIAELQR